MHDMLCRRAQQLGTLREAHMWSLVSHWMCQTSPLSGLVYSQYYIWLHELPLVQAGNFCRGPLHRFEWAGGYYKTTEGQSRLPSIESWQRARPRSLRQVFDYEPRSWLRKLCSHVVYGVWVLQMQCNFLWRAERLRNCNVNWIKYKQGRFAMQKMHGTCDWSGSSRLHTPRGFVYRL